MRFLTKLYTKIKVKIIDLKTIKTKLANFSQKGSRKENKPVSLRDKDFKDL
jgi:hypothetical protein